MVSGLEQSANRLPAWQMAQQPTGHLKEEHSPRLEAAAAHVQPPLEQWPCREGARASVAWSRSAGLEQVQPGASALQQLPRLPLSNFKYRSPGLMCITKGLEAGQGLLPCAGIGLNITPGATRFGAIPESSFPELYFTCRCCLEAEFHRRRGRGRGGNS